MMKKSILILLALSFALISFVAAADDIRVIISPATDKDDTSDLYSDLVMKASAICAEEVMHTKGFAFVPPSDLVRAIAGNDGKAGLNTLKPEDEYTALNMKKLEEIMDRQKEYSGGMAGSVKLFTAVDIMLNVKAERKDGIVKVKLEMDPLGNFALDSQTYSAVVECNENDLSRELSRTVKGFLEKVINTEVAAQIYASQKKIKEMIDEHRNAKKTGPVYADKLIDAGSSKVAYILKTMNGEYLKLEVRYSNDRPDPVVEDIRFIPPDDMDHNKMTTLGIKSREGKTIAVKFDYKNGNLISVNMDTPLPNPSNNSDQSLPLTVRSEGGYLLNFDFEWKAGEEEVSATVTPEINAFGESAAVL